MANNYTQFSEVIEGLTPAACEWIETILCLDSYDGEEREKIAQMLQLEGETSDLDDWPGFQWKIEGQGTGADCKHSLWLYAEEVCDFYQVELFVHSLICAFMPDYIFTLTAAETCSRLRCGEFGGGWMVITKDGAVGSNTWSDAEAYVKTLKKGARLA